MSATSEVDDGAVDGSERREFAQHRIPIGTGEEMPAEGREGGPGFDQQHADDGQDEASTVSAARSVTPRNTASAKVSCQRVVWVEPLTARVSASIISSEDNTCSPVVDRSRARWCQGT